MITHDDMIKAIDRIGRTEDGWLLYLYLQKQMLQPEPTGTMRALRLQNGKRSLASELMGLLSKGLEESAGSRRSDVVVIVTAPGSAAASPDTSGRRGLAGILAKRPDLREFPPDDDQPTGPFGFGQT